MLAADKRLMAEAEGYLELDLPDQADTVLHKVSKEAKHSFEWNFLTAEAHRSRGDHQSALPYLEKARRERPTEVSVYLGLGWCYKRTRQLPKAIDALLEANERCKSVLDRESHALVMYNLSCYYSLAGRKEEMLRWLALALRKCPQYRDLIAGESDFDSFRQDEDFRQLAGDFD